MVVNLNHSAFFELYRMGAISTLKSIKSFDQFLRLIEISSNNYDKYNYLEKIRNRKLIEAKYEESIENTINISNEEYAKRKLKGDLFEIFCEYYLLSNQNNYHIKELNIVSPEKDFGVDFYGKLTNDIPFTVQVKYRNDKEVRLTHKDIKQFPWQSYKRYNVTIDNNMWLLASCNNIDDWSNQNIYNDLFRKKNSMGGNFIGYDSINGYGTGEVFFNNFFESLKHSYNSIMDS